jgi:hypothetical protein|tara:strand:+ start:779 stop:1231 length:453 start_codon:yes stop_codon:yes gene_type:complete
MINSHKELMAEIKLFAEKMELIKDFRYMKDTEKIIDEVNASEPRVLVVGVDSITYDDQNYNQTMSYSFVMADETIYDTDSVINSEEENIFCVSALGDYLKYIADGEIELQGVNLSTEQVGEGIFTSISGKFEFIIKRSPSYWKKMEEYNV